MQRHRPREANAYPSTWITRSGKFPKILTARVRYSHANTLKVAMLSYNRMLGKARLFAI
jgi:hypothetical protein